MKIKITLLVLLIVASYLRFLSIQVGMGSLSTFRVVSVLILFYNVSHTNHRTSSKSSVLYVMIILLYIIINYFFNQKNIVDEGVSHSITGGYIFNLFNLLNLSFFLYQFEIDKIINIIVRTSVIPLSLGFFQTIEFMTIGYPRFTKFLTSSNVFSLDYGGAFSRPTSTFLEPNYYGQFLGVIILCLILKKRYYFSILFVLGLLTTGSRTAFIGTLVAAIFLFFKERLVAAWRIVLIVLVTLVILNTVSTFSVLNKYISYRFSNSFESSNEKQLFGRKDYLLAAINEFEDNPVFGGGIGSISGKNVRLGTGHSTPLTMLAFFGVFGFLLIYSFFFYGLVFTFKRWEKGGAYLFVAIMIFLVSSIGYDSFFKMDFQWLIYAMLIVFFNQSSNSTLKVVKE